MRTRMLNRISRIRANGSDLSHQIIDIRNAGDGKVRVTTGGAFSENLVGGFHVVAISGTGVVGYDTNHTVTSVVDVNIFDTNIDFTVSVFHGRWRKII